MKQSLKQKLQLKLLPHQIQLEQMLKIPVASLEQYIQTEIEQNPTLILGKSDDLLNHTIASTEDTVFDEEKEADIPEEDIQEAPDEITATDDVDQFDELPQQQKKNTFAILSSDHTFFELLKGKLYELDLDDREKIIGEHLIGSMEEDGYLKRSIESIKDDMVFRLNIDCTIAEIEQVLLQIQTLDPPGIGARNLQECLLIQLQRMVHPSKTVLLAIQIVQHLFEFFVKRNHTKIKEQLSISDEQYTAVLDCIQTLHPKPFSLQIQSTDVSNRVIPDFYVQYEQGSWKITLHQLNAPPLYVSQSYAHMLQSYQTNAKVKEENKEAIVFLKQKIESAKSFIHNIQLRKSYLLEVMKKIVETQATFLLSNDQMDLKPLLLKNVADQIQMDHSSLSRIVNSKFVQTDYGIYPLRFFFSDHSKISADEDMSVHKVEIILKDLIASENKIQPYSDAILSTILIEKGIHLSRRSVTFYRNKLGIPNAEWRRK